MSTTIAEPVAEKLQKAPPAEQRLVLRNIDWATYRAVSDALSRNHVWFAYDRGTLEIMTKSGLHCVLSRLIGRLIVILTEELGLLVSSRGDATHNREDLEKGAEPDECFYITNEPLVRGQDKIDLTVDPPPDLVVEVDITSSSLARLRIFAAMCVPEIWRYEDESLLFYHLGANGEYVVVERSLYFPFLIASDIAEFLKRWTEMDENALARSFRTWVRERISGK